VTTFQLDESINDGDLASQCNDEGQCTVRRYPERLKGTKDPVMLPMILGTDMPLLTTDFSIVERNIKSIPTNSSGVIVVRPQTPTPDFTSDDAAQIIRSFKERFPDWARTNWAGLYVEINEGEIFVARLESFVEWLRKESYDGKVCETLLFSDPQFIDKLRELIATPGLRLIDL